MSATLPTIENCCLPACDDVLVQNVPGPAGDDGDDGADGADGVSAVTTIIDATPPNGGFTMPAELASATIWVESTAGFVIGENIFVAGLGTLQVTAILTATTATIKNVEDIASASYASNAPPGALAPIGSKVGPTGLQGPAGLLAGTGAGGDLKGSYPNPQLLIPNALGALAVGNGTDAKSLSAGTNGQIPAYDSTQPLGLLPKSIIPVTGGTNVAADRVARLSAATGLPIPLEASKASIKDPGGAGVVVADASAGNARGTDAVDLQVSRAGVGQVASGARSFIGAGMNNTAAGTECVVTGGENNVAGAVGQNHSVVAGGSGNAASGQEGFVGGGQNNTASNTQGVVCGGDTNLNDAAEAFIGAGRGNTAHSPDSGIVAGVGNTTTAGKASCFVGAGEGNSNGGNYSVITGGQNNATTEDFATIVGGNLASADKHGQRAFAAGQFATGGDCQQSDLLWRVSTTDATPNVEMFLNGATATRRATIPASKTWAFDILIAARSSAGVGAAWTVKGAIENNAGATALVAAVTAALLADGTAGGWGAIGNVPTVDADNGNDALRIRVTGAGGTNIRWTAHGRIMEVSYPP